MATQLVACGGSNDSGGESGPGGESGLTYGYGPAQDGSVTYQPDVVLIQGGPEVIRSASANGLIWTLDGKAEGVSDLEVGKVMYATSRAVGRVAAVEKVAEDVAVTLAPVELTDVFKDAHFKGERELGADGLVYQEIPDLPGALSVPDEVGVAAPPALVDEATGTALAATSGGEQVLAMKPIRFTASDGPLPDARKDSFKVAVGDWSVEPYRTATKSNDKMGLKVGHGLVKGSKGSAVKGLKVFVDFAFSVDNLRVRTDVLLADGKLAQAPTFLIEGIRGFSIDIAAGAAEGVADNTKVRIEVPIEIIEPVPGYPGIVSHFSWKFVVITALSGKNTTLEAGGEWGLSGGIGLLDGKVVVPEFTVTRSIIDSIGGFSVGVSGIVFATELRGGLGIGIPVAFAGPYWKVVLQFGVTNGSALGAALARCVSATLKGQVGTGLGLSLSSDALRVLKDLLPATTKLELTAEALNTFVDRTQILPDVPLCTGGL